ncbi:EAL domain-containing protein [Litchfieldia salsa]|uniref:PAS domain S-box-containing protein/diguanylate cyclase (GGDEF) domain-containing protein n=1 Tax=Litchfieldia salsa TaxID=930152 RepID=A0A1H0RT98_9BACI|nr:EAL domain-containing protein [Litchfieldia salsa]SDP32196.1 PAS domain S-box-containing protein/diguanylate cyclase (GGDEF) domain-containing protein [Litchfieldia salsa]
MRTEKIIGVLTPILDGFYFGNLLISISEKAREYDAKVVVIGTSASNYSRMYGSEIVDGWIVIMDAVDEHYLKELKKLGAPIIGINTLLDCDIKININNEEMMGSAIEHLVMHGHKQIAYVGDYYFHDAKRRFQGYVNALAVHGIDYENSWFYNTQKHSIKEIVERMVTAQIPCTGVVCVNDTVANELIHYIKQHNLEIPNDLAIIGFDDNPTAIESTPSLSTIHLPVFEVGERAVSVLFDILNEENDTTISSLVSAFPIFRESCGCQKVLNELPLKNTSDTINFLSNMVSRNFNLGQLMQSYDYKGLTEMDWLNHTPFSQVLLGLWDKSHEGELSVSVYEKNSDENKHDITHSSNCLPELFPLKEMILNDSFLKEENVIIVIPITQEEKELGVFGFVGLSDITTQVTPLNMTYQLANFFAAALIRANMNEEIKSYSKQLELISNIMYDGIWGLDYKTKQLSIRGGINRTLGYSINNFEISLSKFIELIHPKDYLHVKDCFKHHIAEGKPFEVECRILHTEGYYIWMYITGQALIDTFGNVNEIIGSIMDITERKKVEEKIYQLAYKDTLTGLSNRLYFEEKLPILLDEAKKNNGKVAILLFDIDRFKVINDSYGHQTGDRLLRHVARRVLGIAKESYVIARLGGDEFIIAIPFDSNFDEVYTLGTRIVTLLREPFCDEDREYHISTSLGLSIFPDNGLDAETIILQADIAMYNAKSQGRNRLQLFSNEINNHNSKRVNIEKQLRKALERNEFLIHYQPLYSMEVGNIIGVEALLRWNSSEFGMVMPMDFIPVAEETGLIIPIGEWVLEEVCATNKTWRDMGFPGVKINVNISSKQLNHTNFVQSIKNILDKTGCYPNDLCLEITESTMLKDLILSKKILKELIDLGLSISMDDFGTGFSSLSLLRELPIQTLKIDKSFIDDVTDDIKRSSIVQAIITMSHILSIKVVAEGVERGEQMDVLRELKADYIQGYHISKPLPVQEIEELFRRVLVRK